MKHKPKILLSNDDGIDAPGIKALYCEIKEVGDVVVIAPPRERSAVGHCISLNEMIHLEERFDDKGFYGYACDGTPADCVKVAITYLLKDSLPELVISGINKGQNTSNNIIYSGTVAAAIEGAMLGIPSIAVSINSTRNTNPDFRFAAKFTKNFIPFLLSKGLPEGVILNINIPDIPEEEIEGIEITKQGKGSFTDLFVSEDNNRKIKLLKNIGADIIYSSADDENDDIALILKNKISITPLHFDLTCHSFRTELKKWIENNENLLICQESKNEIRCKRINNNSSL